MYLARIVLYLNEYDNLLRSLSPSPFFLTQQPPKQPLSSDESKSRSLPLAAQSPPGVSDTPVICLKICKVTRKTYTKTHTYTHTRADGIPSALVKSRTRVFENYQAYRHFLARRHHVLPPFSLLPLILYSRAWQQGWYGQSHPASHENVAESRRQSHPELAAAYGNNHHSERKSFR